MVFDEIDVFVTSQALEMTSISVKLTSPASQLVGEIILFARERGIDQATLAARAGISPESLSRLKKGGGCRLKTALGLAQAAGFHTLHIVDRPAAKGAASIAARELSAGRRIPINREQLVLALASGAAPKGHRVHLLGFFEELPIESVHDVVLEEGLDYKALTALAHRLGAEGEIVEWLQEMAGDGVA